ncbi:MAG: hypothetical protein H6686_04745 [Fibrobacteria bacterium]|nr:hypothetical protein [Fibrobacteria bacterium]
MYLLLIGIAILVLVSLFLAGLYVALQKRDQESDSSPQIHNSGVYRLRRSPREGMLLHKPDERALRAHIIGAGVPEAEAEGLIKLWHQQSELNLRIIEEADAKEIRTFQYEIPVAQAEALRLLPASTYVTRDQITLHAQLIPPFHVGCRATLKAKNAWEGGDWTPLLPARDGRYEVPDWRTLVR